jgi:hypothetical protein
MAKATLYPSRDIEPNRRSLNPMFYHDESKGVEVLAVRLSEV